MGSAEVGWCWANFDSTQGAGPGVEGRCAAPACKDGFEAKGFASEHLAPIKKSSGRLT